MVEAVFAGQVLTSLDPRWTAPIYRATTGEDFLGLRAVQQNIAGYLVPGIITITPRARYYAFYSWLLVAREMGVPGDEGEADRWSLDHLFLDQDGIPTFVECKRASDTRTRREVVAQMLDYAANGTQYWPIDRLRQASAETAQKEGKSLDDDRQ